MRAALLDYDAESTRPETPTAEDLCKFEHVLRGLLIALGVARLRGADAEKDSRWPARHGRRTAQQVFVADIERRAFDQKLPEPAWVGQHRVERRDCAIG